MGARLLESIGMILWGCVGIFGAGVFAEIQRAINLKIFKKDFDDGYMTLRCVVAGIGFIVAGISILLAPVVQWILNSLAYHAGY